MCIFAGGNTLYFLNEGFLGGNGKLHNFCRRCFGEKSIVPRVAARKGTAGSSQELPRRGELH